MGHKHLMFVHGRATKPDGDTKLRLVREALLHRLQQVDAEAHGQIERGEVKVTLVYYGDILNRLLLDAGDANAADMVVGADGKLYEPPDAYDASLTRLKARSVDQHTAADYRRVIREERDLRFVDDLARLASPLIPSGLTRRIIRRALPDLDRYIGSRREGSAIRVRLQEPLKRALDDGDDICIVSHSMGCVVAYDVLWKFSQMSEYARYHDRRIGLWITLGSPLGEPAVQGALYDSNEPPDGRYPRNVSSWVNVAAHDDFVAHDATVADDFLPMRGLGCDIQDHPRIHTFWVGREGSNPHKLYGYLNHPHVARVVGAWVRGWEAGATPDGPAARRDG